MKTESTYSPRARTMADAAAAAISENRHAGDDHGDGIEPPLQAHGEHERDGDRPRRRRRSPPATSRAAGAKPRDKVRASCARRRCRAWKGRRWDCAARAGSSAPERPSAAPASTRPRTRQRLCQSRTSARPRDVSARSPAKRDGGGAWRGRGPPQAANRPQTGAPRRKEGVAGRLMSAKARPLRRSEALRQQPGEAPRRRQAARTD